MSKITLEGIEDLLGIKPPAPPNPVTPPLVIPQNQNPMTSPVQTGAPTIAHPAQRILGATLPQTQAPGTTQVATVPPPAVQARERKNEKTDAKRRQGTALRQVAKTIAPPTATPPPPPNPNAPPQMANPQFTPAQYQAPKNNALRYIAAGLGLLFGGSPLGGAGASFLTGQNQKAKDVYARQEAAAEQQYNVAQQQAKVNYDNAKAIWDNNADLRARGLNPLKTNPDGTYQPFQYPTPQQAGAKFGDFTSEIEAYDKLQQIAARNGDTAAQQRFANDQSILIKQQQDAQNWEKFIITQNNEDRRATQRENREDAREKMRLNATTVDKPLTAMQKIELTSKANTAMRQFNIDWSKLTQPHITNSGITAQPPIKASLIPRLNPLLSLIRQSQDPQGLANHLSSITKDPNAQQLIQEYGDAQALQRQAQGQPIVPGEYASIPESSDEKLQALYIKAQEHGYDVTNPKVLEVIMKHAGVEPSGGSDATPGFPE